MSTLVVIPARWGSTRFEGKPLAVLAGRTLLERVIDLAVRGAGARTEVAIVVATDDERVAAEARRHGQDVVMTSSTVTSGSGRALAAAEAMVRAPSWVVSLQADAPFMPLAAVEGIIDAGAQHHGAATPVVSLDWPALDALRVRKRQSPFSGTCCIRDQAHNARWFSKQIIPAIRGEDRLRRVQARSPVLRHLGLYGYALDVLRRFEAAPPSTYELLEGLEQLRLLELGIPIRTIEVEEGPISMNGIDTPEDLAHAEELIRREGDPFGR